MKPKLINFSWTPGPARSLVPVILKLNKENNLDVVSVGYDHSEKVFNETAIPYKKIQDYGINDFSINSITSLLDKAKPQIVLTGTSPEQEKGKQYNIEQAAIYSAKKRGIPSLTVVDIWMDYPKFFDDLFTGKKFEYMPDKVGVLDRFMKEDMMLSGFEEKKLVITGNPFFDEYKILKENFKEEDRKKVREDLGVDVDSYLFLYASQPLESIYGKDDSSPKFLGYTEKTVLRDVIDSIKKISKKDKTLLVKVHPREEQKDLEEIAKNSDADFPIVLNKGYNTRQSVLACDVVLSPFSTVLMEAIYIDKPAVSVQPNLRVEDFVLTNKFGITVPRYTKENLDLVLERLVTDGQYNKELKEKRDFVANIGNATDNVISLIYKMLGV